MAQLFVDSFSIYATADLPTRYPGGSSSCAITTAVLPPNSQAGAKVLQDSGGAAVNLSTNYGPQARMIAGFRHYKDGIRNGFMFQMLNAAGGFSTLVCGVYADTTGTFIYGPGNVLLGSAVTVPLNEWHHYELDVIFGAAANATINLYLDGNPVPFISLTGQTLAATAAYFGLPAGVYSGAPFQTQTSTGEYADFYFLNGTGPVAMFNSALAPQGLGAAKMAFAVPNAPGTVSAWTPNGAATIWQSIDQIPQDGDTTYASSATVGQQYMTTFGALPAMQSLLSVQLSTYARTDDAGPRAYQSGFWSGGTFGFSGMNQFLGGTYNYVEDEYMLNPITSTAWTPSALVGLQFGAELTV